MSKQALDTGTDGRRVNAFALDPDTIAIVGRGHHKHARKCDTKDGPDKSGPWGHLWDERAMNDLDNDPELEGLIQAIMLLGFRSIIEVEADAGQAYTVDGRRRVIAARYANERLRKAGKEPVLAMCHVTKGDPGDFLGISRALNAHRKDDSPLAKARDAARLLGYGKSRKEVAVIFGVKESSLDEWLAALSTSPEVQEQIEAGMVSPTAAAKLARNVPRAEQASVLRAAKEKVEAASKGKGGKAKPAKVTVRDVKRQVAEHTGKSSGPRAPSDLRAMLESMGVNGSKWDAGRMAATPKEFIEATLRWALGEAINLDVIAEMS